MIDGTRIKEGFDAWWLGRGAFARKLMRLVLTIVAVAGLVLLFSFESHTLEVPQKGTKTRITVGWPTPWIVWERAGSPGIVTNPNGSTTVTSMSTESSVDCATSSFLAGLIAVAILGLVYHVRRIEKEKWGENINPSDSGTANDAQHGTR
jgi:hypothetical protein